MAKQVPIIDSNGQFSHRKRAWVNRHEAAGSGAWNDGVFVFHRRQQPAEPEAVYGAPGNRAVSLMDRLWDRQPDRREFAVDAGYWDGRACLRFWGDQASHGRSTGN